MSIYDQNDGYESDDDFFSDDYTTSGLQIKTLDFVLKPPVGHVSLLQCRQDRRDLPEIIDPSPDDEVEFEPIVRENDVAVICDNGIVISSDDINGYNAMTPNYRNIVIASKKYFLDKLDGNNADFYQKAKAMIDEIGPDYSLADLYRIAIDCYPIIRRIGLDTRLSNFTEPEKIGEGGRLASKPEPLSGSWKGNVEKLRQGWTEFVRSPLRNLREDYYICIAAAHLFYWFAGGHNVLVNERTGFISPIAVQLHGQEMWWMLHLVSPHLDRMYDQTIVKRIRRNRMSCSAFNHRTGDGFAIDFWQTWVMMFDEFESSVRRFYRNMAGDLGSPESISNVAEFRKIDRSEVTPQIEAEHFSKTMTFLFQGFVTDAEENKQHQWITNTGPLDAVFIAIARDIEMFRKREIDLEDKGDQNEKSSGKDEY